jgi:hypothetical protein
MIGVSLIMLVIYVTLNTGFTWHFSERPGFLTYDMLGEAYLSGQLYLKQEVDKERLDSGDALNPLVKRPFLFDAIIWNGRYYLQHEPLPAVLHAAWMLVTTRLCPTGVVVVGSALGSFLMLGLLLCRMRIIFFPQTSLWIVRYCWWSFGISGIQLYLVGRPVIYHEAIALGNFFLLSGIWALLLSWHRASSSLGMLSLSGFLLGSAVACRLPLAIYPFVFSLCYLVFFWRCREIKLPKWSAIAAWSLPMVAFAGLLLAYNYFRFGDLLDFGRRHVIFPTYLDFTYLTRANNFYRASHVPINLYYYLLQLPTLADLSVLRLFPIFSGFFDGEVYVARESMGSLFVICPMLLLCFFSRKPQEHSVQPTMLSFVLLTCAVSSLAVFFSYLAFVRAVPRYAYDFVPVLFILVYCNVVQLWTRASGKKVWEVVVKSFLVLLFIASMMTGVCLGYRASRY